MIGSVLLRRAIRLAVAAALIFVAFEVGDPGRSQASSMQEGPGLPGIILDQIIRQQSEPPATPSRRSIATF